MAHWDTSAILKLFLAEPDSDVFEGIVAAGNRPSTASIARHEARAAFFRKEGEGALAMGEADRLYLDLLADFAAGDIREMPKPVALEAAYGEVLRECLLHSPPVFLRANDALHLASARWAGETEFVTADNRQRAAALHLGFTVCP